MARPGVPGALRPGDVVWARPEITVGRERAGRRPAMVVAGAGYLEVVGGGGGRAGRADQVTLVAVRGWIADFLDL